MMEDYLVISWVAGAVAFPFALAMTAIGANERDRDCARIGLAGMLGCAMAPLTVAVVLPILAAVGLIKAVRVAELPALLPGPKEQSPGQLSLSPKRGGEVSEVHDGQT